ncbi:hypothetical protein E2562_013878 [Oryza meyeriana var. granulata]|uniref:Uncharacterized protein n=1 Tax=Oryza meyeriana var. granulata TaxID=110450 RepID=A0A6G1C7K0_9ORYZ|nr:hypothetical protein E2562_013878 [Oryza meyeriana var. granulata]
MVLCFTQCISSFLPPSLDRLAVTPSTACTKHLGVSGEIRYSAIVIAASATARKGGTGTTSLVKQPHCDSPRRAPSTAFLNQATASTMTRTSGRSGSIVDPHLWIAAEDGCHPMVDAHPLDLQFPQPTSYPGPAVYFSTCRSRKEWFGEFRAKEVAHAIRAAMHGKEG